MHQLLPRKSEAPAGIIGKDMKIAAVLTGMGSLCSFSHVAQSFDWSNGGEAHCVYNSSLFITFSLISVILISL